MFHINPLVIFLLCSGLLIPVYFFVFRIFSGQEINIMLKVILRYWLWFIFLILCLRVLMGLILISTHMSFSGVSYFYPIRIAYPNYGLLRGLPYIFICFGIFIFFQEIQNVIINSRFKYILLWIFSTLLLLFFGAIHSGFILGNDWIATASDHLFDISINKTISHLFMTHIDRIKGLIAPNYRSPHAVSQPAFALAYAQLMIKYTSTFIFSVVNVALLSLAFPVVYWALRRSFSDSTALQTAILCLLVPGILVYGRTDDAVYYALAIVVFALMTVSILEKRYFLTCIAAVILIIAMNFSYAVLLLFPAIFSLNSTFSLLELWRYLRQIFPYLIILFLIVTILIFFETRVTHYHWLNGLYASVDINKNTNVLSMLKNGFYTQAINERIMSVCDFLIFAGPLFLYLFVCLVKNSGKNFGSWKIKNFALLVMLCVLGINSTGPGEVSRPWGGLFLLIAFSWFPELLDKESKKSRFLLIRVQFAWALFLQIFLNFSF